MTAKSTNPPRKRATFAIDEQGGDQFADLAEAQRAALPMLSADLAAAIRRMIATGALAVQDGRVQVAITEESL